MADRSVPTTAAIAVATAIIAALGGFFLGQASSLGMFSGGRRPAGRDKTGRLVEDTSSDEEDMAKDESEDEEVDEDEEQELSAFAESNEECKLVLVVRTDLGMTKGVHASSCPATFNSSGAAMESLVRLHIQHRANNSSSQGK